MKCSEIRGQPFSTYATESDGRFRGPRVSDVVRLWMPDGAGRGGAVLAARVPSARAVRRRRRAAAGRGGRGIGHLGIDRLQEGAQAGGAAVELEVGLDPGARLAAQ